MDIYLDSNIYIRDPLLRNVEFEVLADLLKNSDSELILTEVVLAEVVAHYRRDLAARLNRFEAANRSLHGLLKSFDYTRHAVDIDAEVELYKTSLLERFDLDSDDIRAIEPDHLRDVLYRAIERRKPCTDKGSEMRDAVIWLSVLDAASESFDDAVAFVSANTNHFAESAKLHPDLQQEAEKKGLVVNYYPSLAEFIQHQSSASSTYSKEWFLSHVPTSEVVRKSKDYIQRQIAWEFEAEKRRGNYVPTNASPTGTTKTPAEDVHLAKYFVYPMCDGTLRGLAIFHADLEVEFEYEYELDTVNNSPAAGSLRYGTGRRSFPYAWQSKEVRLYPRLELYVAFSAKGGDIIEWHVQET